MDTIPDRSRRDPDIAPRLRELRVAAVDEGLLPGGIPSPLTAAARVERLAAERLAADDAARQAEDRAARASVARWLPPSAPGEAQIELDGELTGWHGSLTVDGETEPLRQPTRGVDRAVSLSGELPARFAERLDAAELTPEYAEHLARQGALDAARIRALEAMLRRRDLLLFGLCLLTIWLVGR